MKQADDPVTITTRKLDGLQERMTTFQRLREHRGATIDESIFTNLENNYCKNLEILRTYKAYNELRAYTAWWKRYLNRGDLV